MLKYLSPDWIDALREGAVNSPGLAEACADVELTLQEKITGTADGTSCYYITFDHGTVYVQAGEAHHADVTFEQDYKTARAVALGEQNALEAIREGEISLSGDPTLLQERQDVMSALNVVFADVRERTEYP